MKTFRLFAFITCSLLFAAAGLGADIHFKSLRGDLYIRKF